MKISPRVHRMSTVLNSDFHPLYWFPIETKKKKLDFFLEQIMIWKTIQKVHLINIQRSRRKKQNSPFENTKENSKGLNFHPSHMTKNTGKSWSDLPMWCLAHAACTEELQNRSFSESRNTLRVPGFFFTIFFARCCSNPELSLCFCLLFMPSSNGSRAPRSGRRHRFSPDGIVN